MLLVAGIIGLVTGAAPDRRVNAGATGYPAVAPLSDQAPGPGPAPQAGPTHRPPRPARTSTPTPTQSFVRDPQDRPGPPSRQDSPTQDQDPEFNRPGG